MLDGSRLGHDFVGDRADEVRGDFGSVALSQKRLNLAHAHAARVHGNNALIEAGKAPLMLRDQNRIEAAIAVAWQFDPHRAAVGDQRSCR